MKSTIKLILLLLLLHPIQAISQSHNSYDGWGVKPEGKLRILNIFINIIYDQTPDVDPRKKTTGICRREKPAISDKGKQRNRN